MDREPSIYLLKNFEFRQSIQHSQAGFDPPFAEGAEFTEWKTDAFMNQATMAGLIWNLYIVKFK